MHDGCLTIAEACTRTDNLGKIDLVYFHLWCCILLFHILVRLFDYLTCYVILFATLDDYDVAIFKELAIA